MTYNRCYAGEDRTVRMFLLMRVMYNKIYQKALTCGV